MINVQLFLLLLSKSEPMLSRRSAALALVSSEMLGLLIVALRPPATRLGLGSESGKRCQFEILCYREDATHEWTFCSIWALIYLMRLCWVAMIEVEE